jgi:hypothetical protein
MGFVLRIAEKNNEFYEHSLFLLLDVKAMFINRKVMMVDIETPGLLTADFE